MIVLLLPHPAGGGASLGPESLDRLADLGITSISLVRDEQSTGFVLDRDGRILTAVYSSGAIGRLVPEDVLGFVKYVEAHRDNGLNAAVAAG